MQLKWYYVGSVIFVLLTLLFYRTRSQPSRFRFLLFLAFINALAYVVNWWYFYIRRDSIFTLLPLQLCNIAVFLIPTALIKKNALIMDFVFYVCGLGALAAILIVSTDYSDTYSMMTFSFYIFHFSIFIIPVLNSIWGFHPLRPTKKSALRLTLMVLVVAGTLHLFNLFLNNAFSIPANYFFTIKDLAANTNAAFALFASWLPYDFIYLWVAIPILYLYMGIVWIIVTLSSKTKKTSGGKQVGYVP